MKAVRTSKLMFEVTDDSLDVGRADETPSTRETLGVTERLRDVAPEVRQTIAEACALVFGAFDKISAPDELKLKFGVKMGGEAGVPMVSKGTAEASFEIEATWKKGASTLAGD